MIHILAGLNRLEKNKTGFKIAETTGLETGIYVFMVVNKGSYAYWVIQSSKFKKQKHRIEYFAKIVVAEEMG